jgi:folylpolyglutamate synthase/dihydropteroate synthase
LQRLNLISWAAAWAASWVSVSLKQIHCYDAVAAAYDCAVAQCKANVKNEANEQTDRVIMFGSFMTVAAVMTYKGIKA